MRNPILEREVYRIRNPSTGPKDFREALERIGEYLGAEIARNLETEERGVTTVLGEAKQTLLKEEPVLVAILRAAIPLYNGLQKAFPEAETGFIGAMRDEETLQAEISYVAIPEIKGREVVLADTMIATGGSIVDVIKLLEKHEPRRIHVAGAIAAEAGLERIREHNPQIRVYAAATDPELNEKGYIVPGLGDAGDRAYGEKI